MRLTSSLQSKTTYQHYLLLLVICLLAWWPLSFGVFSVKNDAIHYFLPYRFNISEAIRNGEWPFWSPYIYLGYPVYGDMQSGAWNPIVWFFSCFARYDVTVFHFENLLYIFLSGAGMYKLSSGLGIHRQTAFLTAVAYMLSGFLLNGQLINWLAAAAFIPFVLYYYLKTIRTVTYAPAMKAAVALYLLFTAGYPSFFILTLYILTGLFLNAVITRYFQKKCPAPAKKKFIVSHLLLVLVFGGLSLPALVSFIDLLPYYQRGEGVSYAMSLINSFDPQHLLSFLFPSTIRAADIRSATDVTFRNMYIGLFPLLLLTAVPLKLTRRNILLMALAVFSFLFMLGDLTPVRKICFQFLPLMDSFRHPAQVKLFLLISLLLLGAPAADKIVTGQLTASELKRVKLIAILALILSLAATIIFLFRSGITKEMAATDSLHLRAIQKVFEGMTLADGIILNGIIQVIFITLFLFLVRKHLISKRGFAVLWTSNLLVMAQLILPITFVGKTSPREINGIIHASPEGFPLTGLEKSIAENSKDAFSSMEVSGLAYFYNKRPGISKITNSPSFLTQQDLFIASGKLYNYVASLPMAYIADSIISLRDTALLNPISRSCAMAVVENETHGFTSSCDSAGVARVTKFGSNYIEIQTNSRYPARLVLTQNFHNHWKAVTGSISQMIDKTNLSFMSISIPAGNQTTVFRFQPRNTILAMWVQLFILLLLFTTCAVSLIRQYRMRKPTE